MCPEPPADRPAHAPMLRMFVFRTTHPGGFVAGAARRWIRNDAGTHDAVGRHRVIASGMTIGTITDPCAGLPRAADRPAPAAAVPGGPRGTCRPAASGVPDRSRPR